MSLQACGYQSKRGCPEISQVPDLLDFIRGLSFLALLPAAPDGECEVAAVDKFSIVFTLILAAFLLRYVHYEVTYCVHRLVPGQLYGLKNSARNFPAPFDVD